MNIIYATLQQIHSDKWYSISPEMEIAKGKNKIGKKLYKIKRRLLYFLYNKNNNK